MILFSNFNHIVVLCLFIYLGLISGFFYTLITNLKNKVLKKLEKAQKCPLNKKTTKKQINLQQHHIKQKQTPKEKEKTLSKQKNKIQFKKIKIFINKVFLKTICFFINILPHFAIILCISFTYLINYNLNFGYLRVVYVLIWVASFFMAKSLYKILANYFFAFYNWVIKRKKEKWQNKTTITKEKQS